ncbi:hypothetical protein AB0E63_33235 [Kribbella sp. NPDC026596]|uniref:hypothetical protein n=1 Tax=Kribbella sp. NPDC026596 TaxID=3155122 RepID=UPI0033D46249
MTPFLFGVPWFFQVWARPDFADAQRDPQRPARSWRLFGRRRAADPAPSQADRPTTAPATGRTGSPEPGNEPWPYPPLLLPLTEDELITFRRELTSTSDVIARLLAER